MADKSTKHPPTSSHVKDLILLFAIPIGIAIFAALVTYVPKLLAKPKYDFMYAVCPNYQCTDSYSVDSTGHVTKSLTPNNNFLNYGLNGDSALYYYDASTDATRSVTFTGALGYQLNTSSKSPDGYSLSRESSDSGFLFWGNSDSGWYLKNGMRKKKVELSNNASYYSRDIIFLGWIEK